MTTIYDDKIFKLTSNWRTTNDIVRKVGGDKSATINALKRLLEIGYLGTKPDTNKVLYKRTDAVQNEFDFIQMMSVFEFNQKITNFFKNSFSKNAHFLAIDDLSPFKFQLINKINKQI